MPLTLESPTASIRLRALDPELPMLAAQAAMELDNFKLSGITDFAAVRILSLRLNNSFPSAGGAVVPRKALLDSSTVSLIGRALNSSSWTANKVSTIDQLDKELWEIAQRLAKVEAAPEEQPIEKIRDFCVALSESASSCRQAFHDLRPSNPFRR
jgi:hypothetical protein